MATSRLGSLPQLTQALNGSPTFLGVIVATTTKNNHDTATPFNNTGDALKGKVLMLQADAACYVYPGTLNTATVTGSATGNGVLLAVAERVIVTMAADQGWMACVSVSGTTNLKIWELK